MSVNVMKPRTFQHSVRARLSRAIYLFFACVRTADRAVKTGKCKFSLTLPWVNDLLSHSAKCRRHKDARLHLCLAGDANLSGVFVFCNPSMLRVCGFEVSAVVRTFFQWVTFIRMCVEFFISRRKQLYLSMQRVLSQLEASIVLLEN